MSLGVWIQNAPCLSSSSPPLNCTFPHAHCPCQPITCFVTRFHFNDVTLQGTCVHIVHFCWKGRILLIHRAASVLKEVKWWSVCTDWQICCLELRLVQLVASEPGKHPFCSPSILCPTYISQLLFHTAAIAACNCTPPPRCTEHPPRCTPPPRRTQASTQVHRSILQSPQMCTDYRMPWLPPYPKIPNSLYFQRIFCDA